MIRKRTRDCTADGTGSSVDDRNLVFQHGDTDTALSRKWASANRPVLRPVGVYT
jgi:hypothetical protein